MRKNVIRLALCATLFALSFPAHAQQPGKIPRIGFVTSFNAPSGPQINAFQQGLRELGYIEGINILMEYRHPEGDTNQAPELVADLVLQKVDVLVAADPTAIRAAKQATKTIPIIMLTTQDPVATGIVESLARPGGNVTGITRLTRELGGKRLELLKEMIPKISRVGVLWVRPTALGQGSAFASYEAAAQALKIHLESIQVNRPTPDLEAAFQSAAKARVNALITVAHAVLNPHAKKIADLAVKKRLPLLAESSFTVEAGALVSYAANDREAYRRAATYADKILKGTKPADLPVEQAMKFEFVINLKTAKALNLTIPQSVLFRADKVIR